jgi:hypothetical protein
MIATVFTLFVVPVVYSVIRGKVENPAGTVLAVPAGAGPGAETHS